MKIRPIFDRVLIQVEEPQNETKSGIILPALAQDKSQRGVVIAIGDGSTSDGKDMGMRVKVGDKIIFAKYAGTEIEVDDKKYIMIRQADILACIEE